MSNPEFDFNEKTQAVEREGILVPLNAQRASLFAILDRANGAKVDDTVIAAALRFPLSRPLWREIDHLNRHLRKIGLKVVAGYGHDYRSKRLVVRKMPKKWQPDIPPVTDDPSLMKIPT